MEVAALSLTEEELHLSTRAIALTIAGPVALYLVFLWLLHARLHAASAGVLTLFIVTAATVGIAVLGAGFGVPLAVALIPAPAVALIAFKVATGTQEIRRTAST